MPRIKMKFQSRMATHHPRLSRIRKVSCAANVYSQEEEDESVSSLEVRALLAVLAVTAKTGWDDKIDYDSSPCLRD
jgi:hypothetical protein